MGIFTWHGWGHWGYSPIGDYFLDIADALRVFQGDIPYKDFVPTYGALHMFLAAPLFHLENSFFPFLWVITGILIMVQIILLVALARKFLPPLWLCVLLILAITSMAYAPTNSKFILGYSQSGFLAVFLSTLALFILFKAHPSPLRWFVGGMVLGLIPFTKIDLGFTSVAVGSLLLFIWWRKAPLASCGLFLGFFLSWLGGCAFLIAYGGQAPLLLESTLECFGHVNLFKDKTFALRLKCAWGLGLLFILALLFRGSRLNTLRLTGWLRPYAVFLLPLAIITDSFRAGYQENSLKHLVGLNWLWVMIWTLILSRVMTSIIRRRSLRPLRFGRLPILAPLLAISGMGFLRAHGSGWYPLNYFQPAIMLLGVLWLARQSAYCSPAARLCLKPALLVCSALLFSISVMGCRPNPHALEWIHTPFGEVRSPLGTKSNELMGRFLSKIRATSSNETLLCTNTPFFNVLTGMRSAAFYTYFNRLGATGKYQSIREEQCLKLMKDRRPLFIYQGREIGRAHKRFGIDFGNEIAKYIHAHYKVIDEMNGAVLYQQKDEPLK